MPPTTTGVLTKLKVLGLRSTKITDAGCATLATTLDNNALPALELVHLESTPASAAAKTAVQVALAKRRA